MLTGILKVSGLPGQSVFWRFLASLNLNLAGQLLQLQRILRERVWAAAHVGLTSITLDTDTTVHTLYGRQMGARKGYNPKNKGQKSYQPILTFIAETHEYVGGELRNGDRPDGKQIARHLRSVIAALPKGIQKIFARADSGFYGSEAVQAYQKAKAHFIIVARKTSRLLEQLQTADGLQYFWLYDLRHTLASRLTHAGVSPLFVAQIIGHSSTSILSTYARAIDEYRRDAIHKLETLRGDHISREERTRDQPNGSFQ
jgi:hypothetical protein